MANPLEAGFSEDHRGKIRKPPRESVIRNIISPAIEEDRAHGSFQDYLDINKAHVLMLALPERSLRDLRPHGVPPVLFRDRRPLYRDAEGDSRAR